MKRKFFSTLLVLIFSTMILTAQQAEKETISIYVSPQGSDNWSGKLAEADEKNSDGSFKTIQRSLQEIRRIKNKAALEKQITVFLKGGLYLLSEPLIFKPDDSGVKNFPITFCAFPGEQPVISGGEKITGWKREKDDLWVCNIPEAQAGKWKFHQLWINGERRFRARMPNKGYLRIEENPGLAADARHNTPAKLFRFAKGDIQSSWTNLTDIEIVVLHFWIDTHLPIASVDDNSRIVTFSKSSRRKLTEEFNNIGARYYIDNVFEGLDEPGEWYLNSKTGKLYYLANPGEKLNTAQVFASPLDQLLILKGEASNNNYIENISFVGLTFCCCEWQLPADNAGDLQSASMVPGAIYMTGTRNCCLEKCTFENLGTYGLQIGNSCHDIKILKNEFTNLGAGGIRLSGSDANSDSTERTNYIEITDNHIHHLGQIYHSGAGILLQNSSDNVIAHNHIHHLYYTGISVGWVWNYNPSVSINNRIEFNHIHHIGQELLSDMGGIYMLGVSPGTVVRNNLIHDVYSSGYGGWGIYTDQASTHILIENNIVYRTKSAGFHQHFGRENIIRNNIFAFGQEAQIMRTRKEDHLSFTFKNNIMFWKDSEALGSNWEGDNYLLDYNLYFRTDSLPVKFKEWSFREWQARGQDLHSLITDPLFVDPNNDDFDLGDNSPALKLGFKPIDMTDVGPRTWPAKVQEIEYLSSSDETKQPALYYDSESKKQKPLLVGLHSWSADYLQSMSIPYVKWCQQKDWIFIHPNFRGPNEKPAATGSELVVHDILSAVEYAKTHANVDTNRIYLIGISGGGHAALLLAGKAPDIWAGVSSWVPIADLKTWYYQSLERNNKYAGDIAASCSGAPDQSQIISQEYFNRSPINFLQNARGVNIEINAGIHDGYTGSVPISQTLRAFNALAEKKDQLTKNQIEYFVKNEKTPAALESDFRDIYFGDKKVLFRRKSHNVRVTIFEGGHEGIPNAGLFWLQKQVRN